MKERFDARDSQSGIVLNIRVIPRAKRSTVDGVRGGALLVRLSSPPVDGAANAALIDLLASVLEVPRRAVRIVGGDKSRDKRVAIDGLTAQQARSRLGFRQLA